MSGCPMWDEYNQCCMWERLEKIGHPWEGVDEVIRDCLEEMP